MEIPPDILQVLKCSVCEKYLSRGPVYLQHDGAAVCGVCFSPKRPASRNEQYEATAKLLLFPCKNRDLGCQVQVPYVQEAEVNDHEEVCQHRQYVCPVLGSARCDWIGSNVDILKHCEEQHVDQIKDNPATFTHDISKSSDQTFLLRAFQVLFLLHIKICVTSGKIFHAVRYLGLSDKAKNFTFNLNTKRGDEQISKKHKVEPKECVSIQESTSLRLNINSFLDVLGGYDGTTFTVTVDQLASALEKCAKCYLLFTSFSYRENGGWCCEQCIPAKVECKNKNLNCTYKDILDKCRKHELYFCEKTSQCVLCENQVTVGSLYTHYNSVHEIINSGSTWRTKFEDDDDDDLFEMYLGMYNLLLSAAGIGLCTYWTNKSRFRIAIFIPVLSEQLHEYKCVVRITQTATGETKTYTPETLYNEYYDWIVDVKEGEFSARIHKFDVCVNITKI